MATFTSVEKAIAKVTEVAKAEEGYLEKASNAYLDSKTGNAGYNNYTKYWRDLVNFGAANWGSGFAGGPAWAWCAAFVSWVFIRVFGLDLARKLLLHMPYTYCPTMGDLARKAGRLYSTPKAGDIVLFWNGSTFSHTGYVYKVENGWFSTVEGNTNGSKAVVANGGGVYLKSYSVSTYQKKGVKFFRPDYSLAVSAKSTSTTTKKTTSTKKTTTTYVKVKTNGGDLNCRAAKTTNSASLGLFTNGTKLTLVEKSSSSWYKVKGKAKTGNTITGYCSTAYLTSV